MPLFFITGVAGSGKSTVLQELISRGYEAYGIDEDGFAHWHNNKTGYIHPKSSVKTSDRTPDFLNNHTWKIDRNMVEDLASKAKTRPVFVCGVARNENELLDLFTGKFALIVDANTLKHRIATRENNDYGKTAHELEQILKDQASNEERYSKARYILIDATQPKDRVVDDIISASDV